MFFILDLFLSFAVAEALCFLVAVVVPSFIVGIAAGAFVYGGFMVVQVCIAHPRISYIVGIAAGAFVYGGFMVVQVRIAHQRILCGTI
jgi:hypothetical protein